MDLHDALPVYLHHCRYDKNLSALTLKAYAQDLRQFTAAIGGTTPLDQVTKDIIREYVKKLFDMHMKPISIKRKIASLKAFLRYLEFEDHIAVSPFRKLQLHIRVPRRVPRFLSLSDVRRLFSTSESKVSMHPSSRAIAASSGIPDDSRHSYAALQKLVILELLFSTGIRVSELCNLGIDDLNTEQRVVRIKGKGAKERSVVITHPRMIERLACFLEIRRKCQTAHHFLLVNRLGKPMQPHSIRVMLKRFSQEANLTVKATPHMFRHTIATMLIENGVDTRFVQKFLGHSSLLTTQMYTHLSTTAEREMVGKRHPRNNI